MSLQSLISELKRRRVFRVIGVYAVAAWLVIQISDTVLPRLGAPDWTVTLVIALAAIGFVITIGLAWVFDITADGVTRTSDPATAAAAPQIRPRRAAWFAAGILVALSLGWYFAQPGDRDRGALDPKLIAVVPFRVAGADPTVAYLREGLLDLIAATVVGNDETHALDPATTLTAWRRMAGADGHDLPADSARVLARSLGAAHVLLGSVIGTAVNLTISAELIDVQDGSTRTRARLQGSADSITQLVDRISAQVLASVAGEQADRASLLAGVPLPAVRAYLDGNREFRSARFEEAGAHYGEAFRIDSTFVLAAMGIHTADSWGFGGTANLTPVRNLIWQNRDRLSPVDRALVIATLGPNYPAPPSKAEQIAAARELVRRVPERTDALFKLADYLYHWGHGIGSANAHTESARLLDRVLEADPNLAPAALHRMELAYVQGDSATVQRLATHALARDSVGGNADLIRFYSAAMRRDSAAVGAIIRRSGEIVSVLYGAVYHSTQAGFALDYADRAAESLAQLETLDPRFHYFNDLNRGRIASAQRKSEQLQRSSNVVHKMSGLAYPMVATLFTRADSARALVSRDAAERMLAEPQLPLPLVPSLRCTLYQYQLGQGEYAAVAAALPALRALGTEGSGSYAAICADYLAARLAVQERKPDAAARLQAIDSTLATMPGTLSRMMLHLMNFGIANMYEQQGDQRAALRVVRRRSYHQDHAELLSSALLLEGRLAAATGDRAGAIKAFRHFVALMSDADPALAPDVAYANRELQRLSGER